MSESPSNSLIGAEPSTVAGPEQKHSSSESPLYLDRQRPFSSSQTGR